MTRCIIDGCNRLVGNHGALGLFRTHYMRHSNQGLLNQIPRKTGIDSGRFEWLMDYRYWHDPNNCLVWPFRRASHGYGARLRICGKEYYPHRVMCELVHGEPLTPRHEVAHSCRKGHLACVNPHHLRWATHKDNMDDMVHHGTRSQLMSNAKLTEAEAWEILHSPDSRKVLAQRYNVSLSCVGEIKRRESWRHIRDRRNPPTGGLRAEFARALIAKIVARPTANDV